MQRVILASASEWRAKLLRQAGFEVEVFPTDVNEDRYKREIADPEELVKMLAEKKAEACSQPGMIVAADTVVVVNGEIIGKPADRDHAREIVKKMAGNTHQVWTGVCVRRGDSRIAFAEKSEVMIRQMTDQEIEAYLDTNEWVGKAGGYQIQKTLGLYITRVVGSYSNIIGLPIVLLLNAVQKRHVSQ